MNSKGSKVPTTEDQEPKERKPSIKKGRKADKSKIAVTEGEEDTELVRDKAK